MRNDIQTRKVASRSFAHPVSMSWKMENSSKYCFRYTCKPPSPTCQRNGTPPSLFPTQAACMCQWFNEAVMCVVMKSSNRTRAVQLTSSSLNSLLDTKSSSLPPPPCPDPAASFSQGLLHESPHGAHLVDTSRSLEGAHDSRLAPEQVLHHPDSVSQPQKHTTKWSEREAVTFSPRMS
jgi:hypothetical protein